MSRRSPRFNSPLLPLPAPEAVDPEALFRSWESGQTEMVCVCGPTASGKTRCAVSLARAFNALAGGACAEILSADSRQVYRGMDIGSGKDRSEYGEIPVHLLDIADAGETYNVYRYVQDFNRVREEVRRRGGLPVLCGGSGLYIRAATEGYFSAGHPDRVFHIGTVISRELRNELIDKRLDERLAGGMIEEVRRLLEKGVPREALLGYGLEYRYVTLYLEGGLSYADMRKQLGDAIHRFAKRQMTWLRGMERAGIRIHWTDPGALCRTCNDLCERYSR